MIKKISDKTKKKLDKDHKQIDIYNVTRKKLKQLITNDFLENYQ